MADIVAPTLAISASDLNLSLGESTTVTFTFSEAVTG
ncbi:Ig-like domain-containing protein, partial [Acinetobacter sp. GN11]